VVEAHLSLEQEFTRTHAAIAITAAFTLFVLDQVEEELDLAMRYPNKGPSLEIIILFILFCVLVLAPVGMWIYNSISKHSQSQNDTSPVQKELAR
jgi:hypothetical protein